MNKKSYLVAMACTLLILGGCKPSEKNYRSAYEVALAKKEKEKSERDKEEEGMIAFDSPRKEVYGQDTIPTIHETLRVNGQTPTPGTINVAVGRFKMPTNAKSGAEMFKELGYEAFAAKSAAEKWYIIIGSFGDTDSAKKVIGKFRKAYPDYPYVGLDGRAIIVRSDR